MKEQECIQALDQVLARHLSRLIGSAHGVHGLPLTLVTIAALVLVGEREQGSADLSTPPTRYTREELLRELEELGLPMSGPQLQQLELLFSKGYLLEGSDGGVIPLEPAVKTTRLLDLLFRGMPGMTLVAYLIQLYLEVVNGQKDLSLAIESVDTTLRNIGVEAKAQREARPVGEGISMAGIEEETRLRQEKGPPTTQEPPPVPQVDLNQIKRALKLWQEQKRRKGPKLITAHGRSRVLSSPSRRRDSAPRPSPPPQPPPRPPAPPTSSAADGEQKGSMAPPTEPSPPSPPPEATPPSQVADQPPPSPPPGPQPPSPPPPLAPRDGGPGHPASQGDMAGDTAPAQEGATAPGPAPEAPPPPTDEVQEPAGEESTLEPPAGEAEAAPHAPQEPREGPPTDAPLTPPVEEPLEEDIEAKIEAFKQKKALKCPECGTGTLKEEATAAGKRFYSCSNPACQFISWGPPRFVPCPRCKAPYTIEMEEGEKRWLECVNPACGFRQPHPDDAPKKRRRVVRRRVVRRKKRR